MPITKEYVLSDFKDIFKGKGKGASTTFSSSKTRNLNATIRSCLDPKDLKKSTKRNQFCTKTIDEVSAELHCGKYFTLVDAKSGFWMV